MLAFAPPARLSYHGANGRVCGTKLGPRLFPCRCHGTFLNVQSVSSPQGEQFCAECYLADVSSVEHRRSSVEAGARASLITFNLSQRDTSSYEGVTQLHGSSCFVQLEHASSTQCVSPYLPLNTSRYSCIVRSTSLSPLTETPLLPMTIFSTTRVNRNPVYDDMSQTSLKVGFTPADLRTSTRRLSRFVKLYPRSVGLPMMASRISFSEPRSSVLKKSSLSLKFLSTLKFSTCGYLKTIDLASSRLARSSCLPGRPEKGG